MSHRRRVLPVLLLSCLALALASASSSPAGGVHVDATDRATGTTANPCPFLHGPITPITWRVEGRPAESLVCEGVGNLMPLQTSYVPSADGLAACPPGSYVIDGTVGSAYAAWDFAAGSNADGWDKAGSISWGGIARRWELNGRWSGGAEPLLTNWWLFSTWQVRVFFYCESTVHTAASSASVAARPAGQECESGLLGDGGSATPADAPSPKERTGKEVPPPVLPKVEVVPRGSSTLHGGSGKETLEARCTGNETLYGGHGTQTLIAGRGSDTLEAGRGTQTLIGGSGHDTLIGGSGRDTFYAYGARNHILAGPGQSRIAAFGKHDVVDCRNHLAEVLAVRGTIIRDCPSAVHYVKRPSR